MEAKLSREITVALNQQQTEVLLQFGQRRHLEGDVTVFAKAAFLDYAGRLVRLGKKALIDECIRKFGSSPGFSFPASESFGQATVEYDEIRDELVLEPISGVAVPVYQGEILRILQEEDGGQCVDFNAFNLADYKERLDAGNTRHWSGMFPRKGMGIYTNPPRDRMMFEILEMSSRCRAEDLGSRCNAAQFERGFGIPVHTNCQDTYQEVIGAYDLTPDDVHDSFNFWMNTVVDSEGQLSLENNTGCKGDYVDLLAIFDALSIPITCGSGDIMPTSNFSFKRIRVQIFRPSPSSLARAHVIENYFAKIRNARTVADFRVSKIKADRALSKNPDYVPSFVNFPIEVTEFVLSLTEEGGRLLTRVRADGSVPGSTDGEIFRACCLLANLFPNPSEGS